MVRRDSKGNIVRVSKAVIKVFRALPQNKKFYGWELKELCCEVYPELSQVYTDTFLRMLRKYFSGCYDLLSKAESLYVKTSEQILEQTKETIPVSEFEKYKNLKQQSFNFGA